MTVRLGKKQKYQNIILNIIAFLIQFVISFYVSPYIVKNVGASAYGFIGVANDFVTYASVIVVIFNSVAARFIANAYYQKNYEKANRYFNSFAVTNIVIGIVLAVVTVILVPFINHILTIPSALVFDVQMTFIMVFCSYIATLVLQVLTTSTFVSNRTDINGIRNIIQYIIRFAVIIVFLNFVSIKIYWVPFATFISTAIVAVFSIPLVKKLTPELTFNIKFSNKKYVITLAKAGCWMAITSLSSILLRGLDLTIANIMIGDYDMGLLSISRAFPNNITAVISVLAPLFTPTFIVFFAKKDMNGLVGEIKSSINTMSSIMFVPISCFIVFSYDFYKLWQNSLNDNEIMLITTLSIFTAIQAYFNSSTATMAQLSVVTNKLKIPVFVSLGCGVLSVVSEILLLKYTRMGLYAIVIPTTIIMVLRYIIFNSIYAAYCVGKPKTIFIPTALKKWISIPFLLVGMFVIRLMLPVTSWISLCSSVTVSCIVGFIFILIVYNRKFIIDAFNRIKRTIER